MKILHTEASCGWGGQEIRILSEATGCVDRGHQVLLACPPEARIYSEAQRAGLEVIALPIGRKNLAGFLAMRRFLAATPVDVINTHSSTDTWLAALACATLGDAPPLVRTRHISAPISANAPTRWLYGKASAHVATTGEMLRQDVIAATGLPADRVTSVPTGIDTDRYAPGNKAAARATLGLDMNATIVGIVATLRSWKGHRYLIEAISQLPEVRLVIVGDGPQREALGQLVAELGMSERVTFPGNREDVPLWLQAFDCFVLPSYANEGVPQALMQAMSAGLPCITTLVGAIGELAKDGDTALVVPPQDTAALLARLQELLGDAALRQRLGERARQHVVASHGRATMLDRMERIFRDVVSAR